MGPKRSTQILSSWCGQMRTIAAVAHPMEPIAIRWLFVDVRARLKAETMSGGTKPRPGTRRAAKYQDGAKKGGGVKAAKHAGPGRPSKTSPQGTKGRQLQRRAQP
jgi:hypothetical protein